MYEGAVAAALVGPHESLVEAVRGSGDVLCLPPRLARVSAVVAEPIGRARLSTAVVNSFLIGRVDAILDSGLIRVHGVREVAEQVSQDSERAARLPPLA
jgi:hypothetical protein